MNKRLKKKKNLFKNIPDKELYDLNYYMAKYIADRLEAFTLRCSCSYPANLKDAKEWRDIINKMIWSFRYIQNDNPSPDAEIREDENKKYDEGMQLFAKYLSSLWD